MLTIFHKFNKIKHLQKGASIVTAIFLLVVLAGLGAMMVNFFVVQQQTSGLDVQGSRAYRAARAGIEWGAFNVFNTPGALWGGCAGFPGPAPGPVLFAPGTLAADLAPFTVNMTCAVTPAVEAAGPIWIYTLTATANAGGAPGGTDYVERQVTAQVR
jgi:MSHA biogenesis protein MshP